MLNVPSALAFDKAGNLFIADTNNNRIRRVAVDGTITTVAGNGQAAYGGDLGPATSAALNGPAALAFDTGGNLYIADTLNHAVRMMNPAGTIRTIAGSGTAGYSGDGGPANQSKLNLPFGVTASINGDIYIADTFNFVIRKVSNGTITTVASVYSIPGVSDGPTPHYPFGMTFDPAGNLLIAASAFEAYILKYSPGNGVVTLLGGQLPADNVLPYIFCCDNVPATQSYISPGFGPHVNITIGPAGDLYIADIGWQRVRKLAANGIITTVAGNSATALSISGEGAAAAAAYLQPSYLTFDRSGSLLFTNGWTVRKISPQGIVTTVAGTGQAGLAGDGGLATQASFQLLGGIAADRVGNLYIADTPNNLVRKVDLNGIISTFAGNGNPGSSGEGVPAKSASLGNPAGIAVDSKGNVYITADGGIREVTPDGNIRTFAAGTFVTLALDPSDTLYAVTLSALRSPGSVVYRFDANGTRTLVAGNGQFNNIGIGGPATQAGLERVKGIAFDAAGTLYITDANDNLVLYVWSDGILRILAGNGTAGFTGDGGAATAAQLSGPVGLVADAAGNLYIADEGNGRIRKFTPLPNLQFTSAGLVNAASFQAGPVASEEIVTWFGATQVSGVFQPNSTSLPFNLGATSVKLKDSTGNEGFVPLYLVAPNQVSFMVPLGTPAGPAMLTTQNDDGRSASAQIAVGTVAPGLFSANSTGQGVAAAFAVHVGIDGSQQVQPVFQCDSGKCSGAPISLASNDAQIVLSLYGTGIRNATSVSATIGGQSATVLFAGPQGSYFGLDQVNLAVPKAAFGNGTADLVVTTDGRASNAVQVLFQ